MSRKRKPQRRAAVPVAAHQGPPRSTQPARLDLALDAIDEHASAVRFHTEELNQSVRRARAAGGSWSVIASAADMTPQGAHRRWRETPPTPLRKAPEAPPQVAEGQ